MTTFVIFISIILPFIVIILGYFCKICLLGGLAVLAGLLLDWHYFHDFIESVLDEVELGEGKLLGGGCSSGSIFLVLYKRLPKVDPAKKNDSGDPVALHVENRVD